MANPEHLEILKQGVKAWNEWRKEHFEIKPDLGLADLRDADLRGADLSKSSLSGARLDDADIRDASLNDTDLSRAYLSRAVLDGANLSMINLSSTDLRDVELSGVNLHYARLTDANLINGYFSDVYLNDANLKRANLSGGYFSNADLTRADLSGADFTNVILGHISFGDNDLSQVKGLETVIHSAPSYLSIDTIYKSHGKIPEVFLRGCGVPESFIVQMHALVASAEPIQFYKSFISYSSNDQKFASRLYADLQNKGVRCWLATEDLKIGEKIRRGIDEAIRMHDKLLLVLSKYSVASDWVEQEVETALDRERKEKRTVLFPIRLDDAVMKIDMGWPALIKNTRNIGDFRKWRNLESYNKAFDRLLRDLKAGE